MKAARLQDFGIALVVVVVGGALFWIVSAALEGSSFSEPGTRYTVLFPDATGLKAGSQVKIAGALAGTVDSLRVLSPEERMREHDPRFSVAVDILLDKEAPSLPGDVEAAIAADTLLSEKFVNISPGNPAARTLPPGSTIRGMAPVTFDQLTRQLGSSLNLFSDIARSFELDAGSTSPSLAKLIQDADATLGLARDFARSLHRLVEENDETLEAAIKSLHRTGERSEAVVSRLERLIQGSEPDIRASLRDLRVTARNLNTTSVYTKSLAATLLEKPSRLLFGGKPIDVPSEEDIHRDRR